MEKSGLTLFTVCVLLSFCGLSSCKTNSSASFSSSQNDENSLYFKELQEIDRKSLSQDYFGINTLISITIDGEKTSSNSYLQFFKDENNDQVFSLVDDTINNPSLISYYIGNNCYEYNQAKDFLQSVTRLEHGEQALFSYTMLDNSDEFEEAIIDVSKSGNNYTLSIKDFASLFHQITSHAFNNANYKIVFPEVINIDCVVENGFISSEKCALSFVVNDYHVEESVELKYDYGAKPTIPAIVIECVKYVNETSSVDLSHFGTTLPKENYAKNIKKIVAIHDGIYLPTTDGMNAPPSHDLDYFSIGDAPVEPRTRYDVQFDGRKYLVLSNYRSWNPIMNSDTIYLYNATTMQKMYEIQFEYNIEVNCCYDGKIAITFLNNSSYVAAACVYSLDDFSLIYSTPSICNRISLFKNKIYYSAINETGNSLGVYNIASKETKVLISSFTDKFVDEYERSKHYLFDIKRNVFFFWNMENNTNLHCYGFDIETDEKIFDVLYENREEYLFSTYWDEDGLACATYQEKVDSLTGTLVPFDSDITENYVLPSGYDDFVVRARICVDEKYDFIYLREEQEVDGNIHIGLYQYWLYDKKTNECTLRIYIDSFNKFWSLNDGSFIAVGKNIICAFNA